MLFTLPIRKSKAGGKAANKETVKKKPKRGKKSKAGSSKASKKSPNKTSKRQLFSCIDPDTKIDLAQVGYSTNKN